MDVSKFFREFQEYLAPRLDVYEQAIYLYIFRQSRFLDKVEVVIGFRSARDRIAASYRYKGQPISMETCYAKLRTLQEKGCIELGSTEQNGFRIRLHAPSEIAGVVPVQQAPQSLTLEEMDFFTIAENRRSILLREKEKCFYCLQGLDERNHVIEHVVSRPNGNNSYRNVVAACRRCNNRKGDSPADDYLRALFREGFLSADDLEQRMNVLRRLRAGELVPTPPTLPMRTS